MPDCFVCDGTGIIDWTDDRAMLTEHLEGAELQAFKSSDIYLEPIQQCPECEGTGVVSRSRLREIRRSASDAIRTFMERQRRHA